MKKLIKLFSASLIISIILISCANEKKSITGQWILKSASGIELQDADKTYLIINEDNTAIEKSKFGEMNRTWSIKGNELCLKATDSDGGIESCGTYKLDGNKLIWNVMDIEMIYQK